MVKHLLENERSASDFYTFALGPTRLWHSRGYGEEVDAIDMSHDVDGFPSLDTLLKSVLKTFQRIDARLREL